MGIQKGDFRPHDYEFRSKEHEYETYKEWKARRLAEIAKDTGFDFDRRRPPPFFKFLSFLLSACIIVAIGAVFIYIMVEVIHPQLDKSTKKETTQTEQIEEQKL